MPNPPRRRPAPKSNAALWIVVISLAAVVVLGVAVSVGAYFLLRGSGKVANLGLPGSGRAAIDPSSVENTSAWAEGAMKKLKDADGMGTDRVEKELKDSLLGKQVRWSFPVEAVDEGEAKLDTFFGTEAGPFRSDDPKLNGKPSRRLDLRVLFEAEKDVVKVGDEVTQAEAGRLNKGDKVAVVRTVSEVELTKRDPWFSQSPYTGVVDTLEPYCVTITLVRK